jgi:hypothetical protein
MRAVTAAFADAEHFNSYLAAGSKSIAARFVMLIGIGAPLVWVVITFTARSSFVLLPASDAILYFGILIFVAILPLPFAPMSPNIQRRAKLLAIESTFTESSMKHGERDQIRVVYADPTVKHPDSLLVESSFHMKTKRIVRLGDMENSKLRGHRLVFMRDCYLPHLNDLEYHLRLTYDMHRNTATHHNRNTVNFLRKRSMK